MQSTQCRPSTRVACDKELGCVFLYIRYEKDRIVSGRRGDGMTQSFSMRIDEKEV